VLEKLAFGSSALPLQDLGSNIQLAWLCHPRRGKTEINRDYAAHTGELKLGQQRYN